jgi:DNA-binding CsgD family transcriptional regulator
MSAERRRVVTIIRIACSVNARVATIFFRDANVQPRVGSRGKSMTQSTRQCCPYCRRRYPEINPWIPRPPRHLDSTTASLLTERQREIGRLIAQGYDDAEIAQSLGLSRATVHNHLYMAYQAAGLRNRAHLAALMALEHA